jgi:hypothetical protein
MNFPFSLSKKPGLNMLLSARCNFPDGFMVGIFDRTGGLTKPGGQFACLPVATEKSARFA